METPTRDASAESSPALEVPAAGTKEYADWRLTGKVPAGKPKAASTPAKETPAEGDKPKEKAAPASETGTTQEHKDKPRSTAETRLNEMLNDLREAGLTPSELKKFKDNFQRKGEQPAAAAKTATEQTAKPAGPKAPEKPKLADFKTYEEYDAAKDRYFEDLASYTAKMAVIEDRQRQANEAATRTIAEKLKDARARYQDADASIMPANKAIFEDASIPAAIKSLVNGSPVFVDLLYTLGSKAEELTSFVNLAKTDPAAAVRKLVLMEHFVQEELAKGSKGEASPESTNSAGTGRGEDGKFKKAPEKETKAPPPPREVSGRGSTPPDEIEEAAKTSDFRRFRDAQNRKALAKHQKG